MDGNYNKLRTPPPPPPTNSDCNSTQHDLARQTTFDSDNSHASLVSPSTSSLVSPSTSSSAGTETAQEVDLTRDFDVELQPMPSRRPALLHAGGSGGSHSASYRRLSTPYKSSSIAHTCDPSGGEYHESHLGRATAASYVEDTLRGLPKNSAVPPPQQRTTKHSDAAAPLPRTYLPKAFKVNSYFALQLLRLTEVITALDVVGLACFYGYRRARSFDDGALYVASPLAHVFAADASCHPTVALAALVYHLLPVSLILALPASGLRALEPFARAQRVDAAGRPQKVKRTLFLQLCELAGAVVFVVAGALAVVFAFFVSSGKLFSGCSRHGVAVYVFSLGAVAVYIVTLLQVRAFARFREHLKMQLGAFKESDQTGDIKAHMLRSKRRRRQQQHLRQHRKATAGADGTETGTPAPAPPKRKAVVTDIKKRLFRGAQLGDLRLLRRSLRVARAVLGPAFARELFPDATLAWLGVFGFAVKNPLHVAAYQGNIAAMDLLVRSAFDVNAFDKVSRVRVSTGDLFWYLARFFIAKPVESADEAHASVFKTTLVTPLHCAVSTGRVDAVRWLLAHGADVNACSRSTARSESRLPPIFLADHPDVVRELLRAGANHLAIPDPGHMNTLTVLQLAYLRHNYAVAQVLEDWGGDVALTPLHTAAAMNDTMRMRYLLRKRVDPDCLGELAYVGLNERTPLHWAAVNGAVDAVELLLEAGADANAQDARGRTPLHWAARVNRLAIVRILLAHGAAPNVVDDSDMTPILCAACAGGAPAELFQAMTAHGADINHQLRSTGDTALHIAVKLEDQATALAILSLGGDILRTNHDGFRAIDCTTSTRLQFELKRAAGTRDVMISYTHSHAAFALKLRQSLEAANVTTWLDLMDPSGIGGGAVWREEIARGITNAAVVLCVLTADYAASEWCLKELALAKQVGTPIVAISTERAPISEELQVYLYTRQIIPFEAAITAVDVVSDKEVIYAYDDDAYAAQVRILLDGVRDEIEKRKEVAIRRILRREGGGNGTTTVAGISSTGGNSAKAQLLKSRSGASSNGTNVFSSMQFDERALATTGVDATNHSVFDSARSLVGGAFDSVGGLGTRSVYDLAALRSHQSLVAGGGSRRHISNGNGGSSRVSSASSMSEDFTDSGLSTLQSNSLVLDPGGYYFHRPDDSAVSASTGGANASPASAGVDPSDLRGSLLESFAALESATASGEQFVFICHGDHHGRFVRKLCVDLCREGGFRCFLDQRHRLQHLPSKIDEGSDESAAAVTTDVDADADVSGGASMSRRILEAKEAILKCSAFVVVLSHKTVASQLVKDQLAFAEDKRKRIVPVVVNSLDLALDMKYSLSRSEFFHFFSKSDLVGHDSALTRLLNALREEVFGISIDTLRQHGGGSSHAAAHSEYVSSYAGSSRGNHDDVDARSGVHDSFVSVSSSSTHSSYMGGHVNGFGYPSSVRRRRLSMSSDRSGGSDALPSFGLPVSLRQSQSFIGSTSAANGSTSARGLASDMSLSMAMIGNFSSLMGRISDDLEDGLDDDDYDDLSYAGVEGGDSDSDDDLNNHDGNAAGVSNTAALSHFVDILHAGAAVDAGNEPQPTPRRNSASSISILERKSDDATMSIDVMDTSTL